jgi:hypothetical protein
MALLDTSNSAIRGERAAPLDDGAVERTCLENAKTQRRLARQWNHLARELCAIGLERNSVVARYGSNSTGNVKGERLSIREGRRRWARKGEVVGYRENRMFADRQ